VSSILIRSTSVDLMVCRLQAADPAAVISALVSRIANLDPGIDEDAIHRVAMAREDIEGTGIGDGVAIPHARTEDAHLTRMCVATLAEPVDWKAFDEIPVRTVFLILGSRRVPAQQLRVLADVSGLVRRAGFVEELLAAADEAAMYEALRSASMRKA
jgi:mannitol/fructose-specific phosphotransferase system IIA component (Ntr-type)